MKKNGKGGVCECGTCSWVTWLLPIVLLLVALVPGWLTSMWGKWAVVIVAALYIIKKLKPCKACMGA
jgi:hypothetical protein